MKSSPFIKNLFNDDDNTKLKHKLTIRDSHNSAFKLSLLEWANRKYRIIEIFGFSDNFLVTKSAAKKIIKVLAEEFKLNKYRMDVIK